MKRRPGTSSVVAVMQAPLIAMLSPRAAAIVEERSPQAASMLNRTPCAGPSPSGQTSTMRPTPVMIPGEHHRYFREDYWRSPRGRSRTPIQLPCEPRGAGWGATSTPGGTPAGRPRRSVGCLPRAQPAIRARRAWLRAKPSAAPRRGSCTAPAQPCRARPRSISGAGYISHSSTSPAASDAPLSVLVEPPHEAR